jgi:hypothetical protein
MKKLDIDEFWVPQGSCFECEAVGDCHKHHVVPRIRGGTKTVLLCESCHGKVHGRDMMNHRSLTKSGLEEARRQGKTLGRPIGSVMDSSTLLAKHADIVKLLRSGHSIRHCAAISGKAKGTVEAIKRAMR